MEIFNFIKWWWGERNGNERTAFISISTLLWIIISGYTLGVKAILFTIIAALLIGLLFLIKFLYVAISYQWKEYVRYRNSQYDRTVDVLTNGIKRKHF
jgi:hypothetical protein